jgi:hypothetical protein
MGLRKKQLYHDKNIFFITTTCHHWLPLLAVGNSMYVLTENLNFYSNINYTTKNKKKVAKAAKTS